MFSGEEQTIVTVTGRDASTGTDTHRSDQGQAFTFQMEGATPDAFETTLAVIDPTADRTITLPNSTGTVALTSQLGAKSFPIDGNTDLGALNGNDKFLFGQSFTTSSTLDINFDMNEDPKGGLATEDMGSVA